MCSCCFTASHQHISAKCEIYSSQWLVDLKALQSASSLASELFSLFIKKKSCTVLKTKCQVGLNITAHKMNRKKLEATGACCSWPACSLVLCHTQTWLFYFHFAISWFIFCLLLDVRIFSLLHQSTRPCDLLCIWQCAALLHFLYRPSLSHTSVTAHKWMVDRG